MEPVELPQLTWQYLASPAGAALLTVITINALRASTGFSPRWLPLATAFVWQLVFWAILSDHSAASAGLSLATTFFVWLSATGGNDLIAAPKERRSVTARSARSFWQRWA